MQTILWLRHVLIQVKLFGVAVHPLCRRHMDTKCTQSFFLAVIDDLTASGTFRNDAVIYTHDKQRPDITQSGSRDIADYKHIQCRWHHTKCDILHSYGKQFLKLLYIDRILRHDLHHLVKDLPHLLIQSGIFKLRLHRKRLHKRIDGFDKHGNLLFSTGDCLVKWLQYFHHNLTQLIHGVILTV